MNCRTFLITLLLPLCLTAYGQLPLPSIPASLTQPRDRADYLTLHFYDAMDWNNAEMTAQGNLMQDWANFLSVLPHCSDTGRHNAISHTIHAIPPAFIDTFTELAEAYLLDNQSELTDEDTYINVITAIASHPLIDPAYKAAITARLDYINRCAPGSVATNLDVTDIYSGKRQQLHSLAGTSRFILLVFFDPECDDCHEALDLLTSSPQWINRTKSGELTIVKAMITDDVDAIYPITTVPSLYLIDGKTLKVIARNFPLSDYATKTR